MKVCVAGKNDIAVNALDYLLKVEKVNKKDLFVVCNRNETGVDGWQKSIKKFAEENGIAIVPLDKLYEERDLLFLSLEFDRIVMPDKFSTDKLFNIHFSNLPRYKGMYTSVMPLLNGEDSGGVTLHRIDSGIDTGEIVAQKIFSIDICYTAKDLYYAYLKNSFELFKENIHSLIENNVISRPQDSVGASYYSKRSVDFSNIVIDYNKTSYEIHNQLRAYMFDVYQLPCVNGKLVNKTILTDEKIIANSCVEEKDRFIISGIDGFKIEVFKA